MNRILFRAFALLLPLIGLGGLWGWTHQMSKLGTDWEVPVRGYDPRDLLRGHFIRYTYDWPGLPEDAQMFGTSKLCITGTAPVIQSVAETGFGLHDLEKFCPNLVRAQAGTREDIRGLETGILYVSQGSAKALEKQLADPKLQGILMFRARDDGLITPIDMRFRPFTPEELKRREERARIN
jgi:GDYXXLXY protein